MPSPTLIIGVGGTGLRVLLRAKERFLEAYDEMPKEVMLLELDTDPYQGKERDSFNGVKLLVQHDMIDSHEVMNDESEFYWVRTQSRDQKISTILDKQKQDDPEWQWVDRIRMPKTIIQPNASVGPEVVIGKNCIIHPGAVIYQHCVIGDNVIVHANAVIGADAFYYKKRPDYYEKMHSCGRVVLEDFVEIGACSTVDRGVSADTIIGKGTKLDNHVHVGHDTVIGKNCLFAAHVGIAGCVNIEDNVIFWGQVGCQKDVTIGAGAIVYAQSGISKSLKGGVVYFGSPAKEAREKMKEMALVSRLPEVFEKLK